MPTKPTHLLLTLTLLTAAAHPQQPWQHLNNPTTAEVRATWLTPPSAYGPEPYYGLNGPVDLATVQRDLDTMQRMGYGAVTVQAGYGMTQPYLSPQYFAFFRQFVAEAKKRDLHVWIVDDAGYPSGFAGGRFTTEHPELRMQALAVTQRISAPAGQPLRLTLKPETVAVTAVSATGGIIAIPLTQTAWTPPAGTWTVLVVEHVFSTSPTRSDTNPKRVKDGSQSLEDYLDPAATAQFLRFTHEQYKQAVGDEFGRTILGFRGDEPDYSIAGLPWTPGFFAAFTASKHYDIRPWLAVINPGRDPDRKAPQPLTPAQARARADYYDVFSQLFAAGFFAPQAAWCAQNHLEYQVHLNHEEAELQLARSEGDFFRDMRAVQVPGIDAIWHQIYPDTISDFPRLAASAAHLYGHPRAFTESFAAYRPSPDLATARYILNEQFVRGINLVETMYFPSSTTPGRTPSPFMLDAGYPALLTYTRRMSYLMAQGRPDANVALLLPTSSLWLNSKASDDTFVSAERLLSEHQVDFDIVDEDFLGHATAQLLYTSASGNAYRTVILPAPQVLSQAALGKLQAFAKAGGKVLLLGTAPTLIASTTILDARPATPADFALFTQATDPLPETPTPPAYPPAAPPAAMQVPPATLKALQSVLPVAPLDLAGASPSLRILRRHWKDVTVYLLFNEGSTPITQPLPAGLHAETWSPESGTVAPAPTELHLDPYATTVLVLH